ncbi:MAG TPA: hypothetical protein VIT43_12200 [Candidatus Dormibacteraeota bacterium]
MIAAQGIVMVVLAVAYAITGRLLGTAILLVLAALALASAWALWPSRP